MDFAKIFRKSQLANLPEAADRVSHGIEAVYVFFLKKVTALR